MPHPPDGGKCDELNRRRAARAGIAEFVCKFKTGARIYTVIAIANVNAKRAIGKSGNEGF